MDKYRKNPFQPKDIDGWGFSEKESTTERPRVRSLGRNLDPRVQAASAHRLDSKDSVPILKVRFHRDPSCRILWLAGWRDDPAGSNFGAFLLIIEDVILSMHRNFRHVR
jgi:hypothetical protein